MSERKHIDWTPELVQTFWDGVAASPLDDLSFGRVAGGAFLDLVAPYLRQDGTHLDFGAGSGHVLRRMLERGLRAAGFDPSPGRQAKLTAALQAHPLFLGTEGLQSEQQYDTVLLMEVIEHILPEQYEPTLARIARFVAPGGRLIVSTPNNEDLEHAQVFCPVSNTYFHPWQHVRSFTPQVLEETLARHGLEREAVMLADFSNDAQLIAEVQALRARHEEAERERRAAASAMSEALQSLAERLAHDASPWQSLLHGFSHRRARHAVADALSTHASALARQARLEQAPAPATPPHDAVPDAQGIIRRIGKESTIVFVARKPIPPS